MTSNSNQSAHQRATPSAAATNAPIRASATGQHPMRPSQTMPQLQSYTRADIQEQYLSSIKVRHQQINDADSTDEASSLAQASDWRQRGANGPSAGARLAPGAPAAKTPTATGRLANNDNAENSNCRPTSGQPPSRGPNNGSRLSMLKSCGNQRAKRSRSRSRSDQRPGGQSELDNSARLGSHSSSSSSASLSDDGASASGRHPGRRKRGRHQGSRSRSQSASRLLAACFHIPSQLSSLRLPGASQGQHSQDWHQTANGTMRSILSHLRLGGHTQQQAGKCQTNPLKRPISSSQTADNLQQVADGAGFSPSQSSGCGTARKHVSFGAQQRQQPPLDSLATSDKQPNVITGDQEQQQHPVAGAKTPPGARELQQQQQQQPAAAAAQAASTAGFQIRPAPVAPIYLVDQQVLPAGPQQSPHSADPMRPAASEAVRGQPPGIHQEAISSFVAPSGAQIQVQAFYNRQAAQVQAPLHQQQPAPTLYKRLPAIPMRTQATQTDITAYHLMATPSFSSANSSQAAASSCRSTNTADSTPSATHGPLSNPSEPQAGPEGPSNGLPLRSRRRQTEHLAATTMTGANESTHAASATTRLTTTTTGSSKSETSAEPPGGQVTAAGGRLGGRPGAHSKGNSHELQAFDSQLNDEMDEFELDEHLALGADDEPQLLALSSSSNSSSSVSLVGHDSALADELQCDLRIGTATSSTSSPVLELAPGAQRVGVAKVARRAEPIVRGQAQSERPSQHQYELQQHRHQRQLKNDNDASAEHASKSQRHTGAPKATTATRPNSDELGPPVRTERHHLRDIEPPGQFKDATNRAPAAPSLGPIQSENGARPWVAPPMTKAGGGPERDWPPSVERAAGSHRANMATMEEAGRSLAGASRAHDNDDDEPALGIRADREPSDSDMVGSTMSATNRPPSPPSLSEASSQTDASLASSRVLDRLGRALGPQPGAQTRRPGEQTQASRGPATPLAATTTTTTPLDTSRVQQDSPDNNNAPSRSRPDAGELMAQINETPSHDYEDELETDNNAEDELASDDEQPDHHHDQANIGGPDKLAGLQLAANDGQKQLVAEEEAPPEVARARPDTAGSRPSMQGVGGRASTACKAERDLGAPLDGQVTSKGLLVGEQRRDDFLTFAPGTQFGHAETLTTGLMAAGPLATSELESPDLGALAGADARGPPAHHQGEHDQTNSNISQAEQPARRSTSTLSTRHHSYCSNDDFLAPIRDRDDHDEPDHEAQIGRLGMHRPQLDQPRRRPDEPAGHFEAPSGRRDELKCSSIDLERPDDDSEGQPDEPDGRESGRRLSASSASSTVSVISRRHQATSDQVSGHPRLAGSLDAPSRSGSSESAAPAPGAAPTGDKDLGHRLGCGRPADPDDGWPPTGPQPDSGAAGGAGAGPATTTTTTSPLGTSWAANGLDKAARESPPPGYPIRPPAEAQVERDFLAPRGLERSLEDNKAATTSSSEPNAKWATSSADSDLLDERSAGSSASCSGGALAAGADSAPSSQSAPPSSASDLAADELEVSAEAKLPEELEFGHQELAELVASELIGECLELQRPARDQRQYQVEQAAGQPDDSIHQQRAQPTPPSAHQKDQEPAEGSHEPPEAAGTFACESGAVGAPRGASSVGSGASTRSNSDSFAATATTTSTSTTSASASYVCPAASGLSGPPQRRKPQLPEKPAHLLNAAAELQPANESPHASPEDHNEATGRERDHDDDHDDDDGASLAAAAVAVTATSLAAAAIAAAMQPCDDDKDSAGSDLQPLGTSCAQHQASDDKGRGQRIADLGATGHQEKDDSQQIKLHTESKRDATRPQTATAERTHELGNDLQEHELHVSRQVDPISGPERPLQRHTDDDALSLLQRRDSNEHSKDPSEAELIPSEPARFGLLPSGEIVATELQPAGQDEVGEEDEEQVQQLSTVSEASESSEQVSRSTMDRHEEPARPPKAARPRPPPLGARALSSPLESGPAVGDSSGPISSSEQQPVGQVAGPVPTRAVPIMARPPSPAKIDCPYVHDIQPLASPPPLLPSGSDSSNVGSVPGSCLQQHKRLSHDDTMEAIEDDVEGEEQELRLAQEAAASSGCEPLAIAPPAGFRSLPGANGDQQTAATPTLGASYLRTASIQEVDEDEDEDMEDEDEQSSISVSQRHGVVVTQEVARSQADARDRAWRQQKSGSSSLESPRAGSKGSATGTAAGAARGANLSTDHSSSDSSSPQAIKSMPSRAFSSSSSSPSSSTSGSASSSPTATASKSSDSTGAAGDESQREPLVAENEAKSLDHQVEEPPTDDATPEHAAAPLDRNSDEAEAEPQTADQNAARPGPIRSAGGQAHSLSVTKSGSGSTESTGVAAATHAILEHLSRHHPEVPLDEPGPGLEQSRSIAEALSGASTISAAPSAMEPKLRRESWRRESGPRVAAGQQQVGLMDEEQSRTDEAASCEPGRGADSSPVGAGSLSSTGTMKRRCRHPMTAEPDAGPSSERAPCVADHGHVEQQVDEPTVGELAEPAASTSRRGPPLGQLKHSAKASSCGLQSDGGAGAANQSNSLDRTDTSICSSCSCMEETVATGADRQPGPSDTRVQTGASVSSSRSGAWMSQEEGTVFTENYWLAHWLYISEHEEAEIWRRPIEMSSSCGGGAAAIKAGQQQQGPGQTSDSTTDPAGPAAGMPADMSETGSTTSERRFASRFKSTTRKMIHRRATIEMYKRMMANRLRREKRVEISRSNGEFGFRIHGSRPVVVSAIERGTSAENCGLQVGDLIYAINGTNILDMAHSDVVRLAHNADSSALVLDLVQTNDFLRGPKYERDSNKRYQPTVTGHLMRLSPSTAQPLLMELQEQMSQTPGASSQQRATKLTQVMRLAWRRRYFALRGDNCLYWFKSAKDVEPLGGINLQGFSASLTSEFSEPNYVIRLIRYGGQPHYLGSNNMGDVQTWVDAINWAATEANQNDPYMKRTLAMARGRPDKIVEPDCCGWLYKFSHKRAGGAHWRAAYFVLKDACLYLFRDQTADWVSQASAVYYLHGYRVRSKRIENKRHTFELVPPNRKTIRPIFLMATNEIEKKRWIAALEYSIDRWLEID